ncbi:efflux RND transporter periplasmic adaptor subunit [Dokdonella sp. MW10]|uniref:efflux RND transporter periplasmic adaptor subunit n=1 Tax=Dokdonella sp. MW10 TaxID=2992926 RepID=UPI003F7FDED5
MIDARRHGVIVNYNTNPITDAVMSRLAPAVAIVIMSTILAACSQGSATPVAEAKKATPSGQPVETARVERGELTARYAGTATLQAEREATLVGEVPGTVLQMLVEEGDRVRKGQVLARLDADRSRLQLREAEADLQRRRNDVERGDTLLARQLIAANTHDQTRADFAVRQAEVDLARVGVARSEIRAPFDGVVTRRWIKQGQLLKAGDPVFDVADFRDLRADLRVPERDAGALAKGQKVDFTVDALAGRPFQAVVERIAPVVDRDSGTVAVTVRVDNAAETLRPGLFARMEIAFLHVPDALLVPKTAVLGNRNETIVYRIEDGKATRVPVRIGHASGARVQILEGMPAGAEVVVTGHAALSDGALVDVLPADAAAVASSRALASTGAKRG